MVGSSTCSPAMSASHKCLILSELTCQPFAPWRESPYSLTILDAPAAYSRPLAHNLACRGNNNRHRRSMDVLV
eukprot:3116527-Amphidinium_carterae.1